MSDNTVQARPGKQPPGACLTDRPGAGTWLGRCGGGWGPSGAVLLDAVPKHLGRIVLICRSILGLGVSTLHIIWGPTQIRPQAPSAHRAKAAAEDGQAVHVGNTNSLLSLWCDTCIGVPEVWRAQGLPWATQASKSASS